MKNLYLLIFGHTRASLPCGLFSSCSECGRLSRVDVRASFVSEHRLWSAWVSVVAGWGLRSCAAWALQHRLGSCAALGSAAQARELRYLGSAAQAQELRCLSFAAQARELRFLGSAAQAQELWCTGFVAPWHMRSSRKGIEPLSPALAGRFFTTGSPGKPSAE